MINQKPKYRGALKGKIHARGFKTIKGFSKKIDVDPTQISRVLNGWEFPSQRLQEKIAKSLEISMNEFVRLL